MQSHFGCQHAATPVDFRRVAGELHSIAKPASFGVASGSDFNGFRRPTWTPKSMLGPFFSMFFLHTSLYRFWLDFLRLRTLKIELPPRREHDFCKIDVDKKSSKKRRFGLCFRMPKRMKFEVKLIPQTCFFRHRFCCTLCQFWCPFWHPKMN